MKLKHVRERQWNKYMRYIDALSRRTPYPATYAVPSSAVSNSEQSKKLTRRMNAKRFVHRYDKSWWID